jgi:hypothetical protein
MRLPAQAAWRQTTGRVRSAMPRIVVLALAAFVLGCWGGNDYTGKHPLDCSESACLRVRNDTGQDLAGIVVFTKAGRTEFGSLTAGAVSGYRDVEAIANQPGVEIEIGARTLRYGPADGAGIEIHTKGRYTCKLTLPGGRPRSALVRD